MLQHIFDSHAHYDNAAFDEDREALLASLSSCGVERVVNIGNNRRCNQNGIELSRQYDFISCTVGFHPADVAEWNDEVRRELIVQTKEPKVLAIGEIGLDYHYEPFDKDLQKRVFEEQLVIAKELDLPVVIHSREAVQDTMDLLKMYRPRGIVHCFSGSLEMAKEVLSLGMYIGFTGVLTFKNARKAVEVVEYAPLDRLLLETDCPYMAPVPLRGQRCDSTMIRYTAERMAEIKGIDPQVLVDQCHQNTLRAYEIESGL